MERIYFDDKGRAKTLDSDFLDVIDIGNPTIIFFKKEFIDDKRA